MRMLTLAVTATLVTATAVTFAPTAQAEVGLTVGSKLSMGSGGACSLGFFARNNDGARLAVTAGHCAEGGGEKVYSEKTLIGAVGYWMPDDSDGFGVTVIALNKNARIHDAYFSAFGNPEKGDYVKKYGIRTDKTEGKITKVSVNTDSVQKSVMLSTMISLPGDSGSAWVGNNDDGATLYGLNVGHVNRDDGGYGYARGFPIRQLIELVQARSKNWGQGFKPIGR